MFFSEAKLNTTKIISMKLSMSMTSYPLSIRARNENTGKTNNQIQNVHYLTLS